MTFFALLTKEIRLHMRRERTVWIIILYILLLGLIGYLAVASASTNNVYSPYNNIGTSLYTVLICLDLLLTTFITPAFTATSINGEKERQTFDLLLCSRLSAFDLVTGKLIAGLANMLLLIAASVPLFSLVLFFGGVSPIQMLIALLVIVISAFMTAAIGLLCSTLFQRPAVSTAVCYMSIIFWLALPIFLYAIAPASFSTRMVVTSSAGTTTPMLPPAPAILLWNPIFALLSTFPGSYVNSYYLLGSLQITPWLTYILCDVVMICVCFGLSLCFVKPFPFQRSHANSGSAATKQKQVQETRATTTA